MRLIRHDSQARVTWLRFGRLVSGGPEVVLIGELWSNVAPSFLESLFDVDVEAVTATPFSGREEFAAKVVYIESRSKRFAEGGECFSKS